MPAARIANVGAAPRGPTLVELLAVSVLYPDGSVGPLGGRLPLGAGGAGGGERGFWCGEIDVPGGNERTATGHFGRCAPRRGRGQHHDDGPADGLAAPDCFRGSAAPMLERRSVAENVAYALEVARPDTRDISFQVPGILEVLGIGEAAARWPSELSGGQRQRAALAQGLAKAPSALFLDEPTSNLDLGAAALVEEVIAARCQAGMACVVASHDEDSFASSPRRLWVSEGRVTALPSGSYTKLPQTGR